MEFTYSQCFALLIIIICNNLEINKAQTPPPVTTDPPPPPGPMYCQATDYSKGPGQVKTTRPYPVRSYPFCITTGGKMQAPPSKALEMSGFLGIINNIKQFEDSIVNQPQQGLYDFSYDHMIGDKLKAAADAQGIKIGLELSHLRHYYDVKQGLYKDMDNWLSLEFHGAGFFEGKMKPIQGLYIQGIQAPLGIPFGEFVLLKPTLKSNTAPKDPKYFFNQNDAPNEFYQNGVNVPCFYYSKAGPTIPSAFIWSKLYSPTGTFNDIRLTGKFSVTFRWHDPPCGEVAFFQFLVIVVFDFSITDYTAFISPIILPHKFPSVSVTGLPYPLYPDWGADELTRFRLPSHDDAVLSTDPSPGLDYRKIYIVSNPDFEQCVFNGFGLEVSGPAKGACAPGPFICDDAWMAGRPKTGMAMKQWKEKLWNSWSQTFLRYQYNRPACELPPSKWATTTTTTATTTTTTGTTEEPDPLNPRKPTIPPTEVDKQAEKKAEVAKRTEQKKVISHGDLCVFIWLVMVPVSNYLARFFKDFPNIGCLGMGFWIVGHVAIHHVGVLLMWISFGLVVSNGVSFLGGASFYHYLFGFPATGIQHIELFTGYHREKKLQSAIRQSMVHVLLGYASSIVSVLCAYNSHMSGFKWYMIVTLAGVNTLASVFGTWVEYRISKKLGMFPPRKLFPVMERILMVNSRPFFSKWKIFAALVYVVVMSVVYSAFFFSEELNLN